MNSLKRGPDISSLIRNRAFTCPSYSQRTISIRSALSQGGWVSCKTDIASTVFRSRARSFETQGRTSSGMYYALFQKQGFACCDCSFLKSHLDPALPKHVLGITCEGKKAFGKWNEEAQPVQVLIYIQVCLHAAGRNRQQHISDHV